MIQQDNLDIAVRSFACKADEKVKQIQNNKGNRKKSNPKPSKWTLIFDTETTVDAAQNLRFGTYQVRKSDALEDTGVFYHPEILSSDEVNTLEIYAKEHGLTIMTVSEFIDDVFYLYGYKWRGLIVGFNLPFDISRLNIGHSTARTNKFSKLMQNGFSFKLSDDPFHPNVQIKHVSAKNSFMQFVSPGGQRTTRGERKKGRYRGVKRGFFLDLKTISSALTSQSHSLDSLAKSLKVDALKHETEEHGQTLSESYIAYAVQDTQTTWECYLKLKDMYATHNLTGTDIHKIHSEASLGKAYLKEMGIQPWMQLQPNFPKDKLGIIMSTYYGGRSEVHIRKEITQVLYCDFLSMYPTVCTLMGLWKFVTATGIDWYDSTKTTAEFLSSISIDELQKPETWTNFQTLVKVKANGEVFPVRAKYGDDKQHTIGANFLTNNEGQWFALADCIAAKTLTGQTPEVLEAITFTPKEQQANLKTICVAGDGNYQVNPTAGDFFKSINDRRREVKSGIKSASEDEKLRLNAQQLSLKLLANSTSYGIFVELNVEEDKKLQNLDLYTSNGEENSIKMKKLERAGSFFHPLLATLITGAARLKLAIAERLTLDSGLDWAFCDTDSMALAKPEGMSREQFSNKTKQVYEWFKPLSPYKGKPSLFQIEDENYKNGELEPLYCYAISSKRYALFNLDNNNKPIMRKVSAHGLGHLQAPYKKSDEGYLKGVQPWQQDTWFEIVSAALEGRQPNYRKLKNFKQPAVSRYAATTPHLLKWFDKYNEGKPFLQCVKPFNFMHSMQAKRGLVVTPKPMATYTNNKEKAKYFDRETGEPVAKSKLKTYEESLAQYHIHPEEKFLNGNFCDTGKTQRRHVVVSSIQHIGKEANKLEEQFYLGTDPDAQLEYGMCDEEKQKQLETVVQAIKKYGTTRIAELSGVSARYLRSIKNGRAVSEKILVHLNKFI
jgi:hypothetical protein